MLFKNDGISIFSFFEDGSVALDGSRSDALFAGLFGEDWVAYQKAHGQMRKRRRVEIAAIEHEMEVRRLQREAQFLEELAAITRSI